jgi:hypothetical protein
MDEPEEDPSIVKYRVVDNEDGSYDVFYKVEDPCMCIIDIKFKNI